MASATPDDSLKPGADAAAPQPADGSARQTHGFQAEVRELLKLMIHSLYSHREIFLRELISNASDANDRLRFAAIADAALLAQDPQLGIRVDADAAAGTVTITRQRHRHDARRGHRQPRHHRPLGHRRILQIPVRRSAEGRRSSSASSAWASTRRSSSPSASRCARARRARPRKPACTGSPAPTASSRSRRSTLPQRGTTVTLHLKADAQRVRRCASACAR